MKSFLTVAILMIFLFDATAQESPGYLELVKAERKLEKLFQKLYDPDIISDKTPVFLRIDSVFREALSMPGSFDFKWDRLEDIGRLTSDDGQVKVFSWLWMVGSEQYRYSAYIQVNGKKGVSSVFPMIEADSELVKEESFQQELDKWHGKIYYELVTRKYKRRTYYTLLGADFNNSYTTIKCIEVIGLKRDKPFFRDQQFLDGGSVRDRVIFEYASDVAMTLRFDERLDMIVFDHLAPLHPIYTDMRQFYGPDGSYDGYAFREGIWVLKQDVDARNER